ncbi:Bug family tripartite tricarboxylate transporter substrate binding protein [Pseudoroseomonas wenyumeiae]
MIAVSRRRALVAPLAIWSAGHASSALAQGNYPTKPVSVIVPFAPSGGADVVSRLVFAQAGAGDGPGFVIENKPGAGGNIGAEALARATPDGYTLGSPIPRAPIWLGGPWWNFPAPAPRRPKPSIQVSAPVRCPCPRPHAHSGRPGWQPRLGRARGRRAHGHRARPAPDTRACP